MIIARGARAWRALGVMLVVAVAGSAVAGNATKPTPVPAGESIYRFGLLPSGRPLHGERAAGQHVDGIDAACLNCHRRSGLGAVEGRNYIPPITGQFLFHIKASNAKDLDLPYVEGMHANREPYSEEALARAIREGLAPDGHKLGVLMPHYALDDADMSDLIGYLKQLTITHVPGVSDSELQFATVITPDADPAKRAGMLAVLNEYFAEKNATVRAISPHLHSYRNVGTDMFRAQRRWQLHVWELTGPPVTWDAQLQRHLAAEPVFAMISGLGGSNWAPVHHFCEQASLPCLFPNVELPVVAEGDFHSMYFTKGVLLEAGLIGSQLPDLEPNAGIRRVVQIYRGADVGAGAAQALDVTARTLGLQVVHRTLPAGGRKGDIGAALKDLGPSDALVLWLRPKDLAALSPTTPPVARVWMSGQMGGLESAPIPTAWRAGVHMAYPYDLPDRRLVRLDYPMGWFRIRRIPVTDFQVQADTYLACGLISETLNHLVDTFIRDYLLERIEQMLEHRVLTGYYPRLTLAPGQRFASKGGFIVHFVGPTGSKIAPDGDWIVP